MNVMDRKQQAETDRLSLGERYWTIYREGEDANDANRRTIRKRSGEGWQDNPYPDGTPEHRVWGAGYHYRDMVNDG